MGRPRGAGGGGGGSEAIRAGQPIVAVTLTMPFINQGNRERRPVPGSQGWDRGSGWIVLGTRRGVKWAKSKPGCLIAPLDLDPASVTWPMNGAGAVIVIAQNDRAQEAARLAGCLLRDGAGVVLVLGEDGLLSRHQKEPM